MGRWLDLAERLEAEAGGCANSANSANRSVLPPNGTNGTNGTGALPADVFEGISKLRTLRAPRKLLYPEHWPEAVSDAERVVMEGWAAQALKLGWRPLELFGIGEDYEGLAAWLAGRRLVLIDDRSAICIGGNSRYHFHRREPVGAVMLWDWAR